MLTERDPFHLIFNSLFDDFLLSVPTQNRVPAGFPPTEIRSLKDGTQVLKFALAGYPVENLHVEVEGSTLIVSADKVEGEEGEGIGRIAKRAFKHKFTDGKSEFDLDKLNATYINGELRVEIPKRVSKQAKSFPISTEA